MLAVLVEGWIVAVLGSFLVSAVIAALVACVLIALAPPARDRSRPGSSSVGAVLGTLRAFVRSHRPWVP